MFAIILASSALAILVGGMIVFVRQIRAIQKILRQK